LLDGLDEYPGDFYNNTPPSMTTLGGDNQTGIASQFNIAPFDVAVWSSDGQEPLVNAPVSFTVTSGGGLLGATRSSNPAPLSAQTYRTDVDGTVHAYYLQPSSAAIMSTVRVTAGLGQVNFNTTSVSAGVDTDGNGLPDPWEQQYFGTTGVIPQADADGDGLTNLQEFQNGTSPTDYYNGVLPQFASLIVGGAPGADGLLAVKLTRTSDGVALVNAPVTFTVSTGIQQISATPGGASSVSVTVRTDAQGVARVYIDGVLAGTQAVIAQTSSGTQSRSVTLLLNPPPVSDADVDGLPDWWEFKYFGSTGANPLADPDADGASNLQEYQRGTLPGVADLPSGSLSSLRLFTPLSR
ncbi:MAG: hypothetical protein RIQ79_478, partial [Verrucomicrobiota bacterium]